MTPSPRRTAETPFTCPTCKAPVARDAEHRPFCSARCKMVDLGRWFLGEHRIPGEPAISFDELDPDGVGGSLPRDDLR